MSNTIIELRHSYVTGNVPDNLANGEIAINTYDGKLFYRGGASNTIQAIERYEGPSGLNGEIQFNNSGVLGSYAGLFFDTSTNILEIPNALIDGNLSSDAIVTSNYIEFGDGTKQYTANAGPDQYARDTANAAFEHANSSFISTNSVFSLANGNAIAANTPSDVANSAAIYANGAFEKANNEAGVNATQNTDISLAFDAANSSFEAANSAGSYANSAFETSNSASSYANSSFEAANSAGSYANSAFEVANSAGSYANSAFETANSAGSYANSAFIQANSSFEVSNSASSYANSAFIQANSSFEIANGAFVRANNSLNANTGGIIDGNVIITGNLIVQGTEFITQTDTLAIHDNMIYLNNPIAANVTNAVGNGTYVIYTTDITHGYDVGMGVSITGITPSSFNISGTANTLITEVTSNTFTVASSVTDTYISGGVARARTSLNPDLGFAGGYYDTSYAHAGLFRDASDGIWKFFYNYTPEPDTSPYIDTNDPSFRIASLTANLITDVITVRGVDPLTQANSAFDAANNEAGVNATQNTDIQSAWNTANDAFEAANSSGSYSNSAFVVANNAYELANFIDGGNQGILYKVDEFDGESAVWSERVVDLSPWANKTISLIWHYVSGSSFTGDIQLDDIYVNGVTYTFESDAEGFTTSTSNIANIEAVTFSEVVTTTTTGRWNRDSGGTPSVGTALSEDHTLGTSLGFYLYAETSTTPNFFNFWLKSPTVTLNSNPGFLSFWEARSGVTTGNTDVYVVGEPLTTSLRASAAFSHANAAFSHANASYAQANSTQTALTSTTNTATAAFRHANSSFIHANSSFIHANSSFQRANTAYLPSTTRLDVTSSGTSAYLFDQYSDISNPSLYVTAGETIAFNLLSISGHPFLIRVSDGGQLYNVGLTHISTGTDGTISLTSSAQAKESGILYWKIPSELAGNTYVYQCQVHAGMVGNIVIQNPSEANSAAIYANSAYIHANAAFEAANSGGSGIDSFARDTANGAYIHANAAFDYANTLSGGTAEDGVARSLANSAAIYANGAFVQANLSYDHANSAYIHANAAFEAANSGGGGGSGNEIINGTSNVTIAIADGTIDLSVNGVINVTSFTSSNAVYNTHIIPIATNIYDLGHTSRRWRNIYTNDLNLNNGIGDWTIVEGEDDLFLYNNKKNKVYKFALIEIDPSLATPKIDDIE